jgi:PilZ domain
MDRRQNQRFDLKAPVTYFWAEAENNQGTGHGITRDVSQSGLFVLTDSLPPVGTAIELELSFHLRDKSLQMRANGSVVRVETKAGAGRAHGFAAVMKVADYGKWPVDRVRN